MRAHVLSAITTEFCSSRDALQAFMESTFFAYQHGDPTRTIDNVLEFLITENMVVEKGDGLKATEIGRLTFGNTTLTRYLPRSS